MSKAREKGSTPQGGSACDETATTKGRRMNEGYHAHDGWFFKRLDGGSVEISATDGMHVEVTLDPSEWASAVASVSLKGETGPQFRKAFEFHTGSKSCPATAEAVAELEEDAGEVGCPVCGDPASVHLSEAAL